MAIETYQVAGARGQLIFLQMSSPSRTDIVARGLEAIGAKREGFICLELARSVGRETLAEVVGKVIHALEADECIYAVTFAEDGTRLCFIVESTERCGHRPIATKRDMVKWSVGGGYKIRYDI